MVVVVLSMEGDQVPVKPSLEVVGKMITSPLHIGAIAVKTGVTGEPTFTVIVVVVAHCPALGVNV